ETASLVPAQHGEGQVGGARHVPVGHSRVAVLVHFQRNGPTVLDGVPEPVQRAHSGVSAPTENELACDPHADHLVVDEVGSHPYQREITPPLADDLVTRVCGDEVREAFQRDGVAIVYQVGYGLVQAGNRSHRPTSCTACEC